MVTITLTNFVLGFISKSGFKHRFWLIACTRLGFSSHLIRSPLSFIELQRAKNGFEDFFLAYMWMLLLEISGFNGWLCYWRRCWVMCCIVQRRTPSCRWTSYLRPNTSHVAWLGALLWVYIPRGTQDILSTALQFSSDTWTKHFYAHGSDVSNPDFAKGRRDSPMTHALVSVTYILWAKVFDFVKGKETRTDGPCKYVFWGTPLNQHGKLMFPRWNSHSAIMRCVCNQ